MRLPSASLALLLVCGTPCAVAQRVVNPYDATFPFGDETFLVSELRGSYIAYEFIPALNDVEFLQRVDWKDRNGTTLMRGASSRFWVLFSPIPPGSVATTTWSRYLGRSFPAPTEQTGSADFSGSTPGLNPCRPTPCPAQYLEPTLLFQPLAQTDAAFAPAATRVGETQGVLGLRAYASSPSTDPDAAFTEIDLVSFASTVEQTGSLYTYTYTAVNLTGSTLRVDWQAAGLTQDVAATSSATRSFVSELAPTSQRSLAVAGPGSVAAGGGMDLLTPVPEPSRLVLLLAGGVALLLFGRRPRRPTA